MVCDAGVRCPDSSQSGTTYTDAGVTPFTADATEPPSAGVAAGVTTEAFGLGTGVSQYVVGTAQAACPPPAPSATRTTALSPRAAFTPQLLNLPLNIETPHHLQDLAAYVLLLAQYGRMHPEALQGDVLRALLDHGTHRVTGKLHLIPGTYPGLGLIIPSDTYAQLEIPVIDGEIKNARIRFVHANGSPSFMTKINGALGVADVDITGIDLDTNTRGLHARVLLKSSILPNPDFEGFAIGGNGTQQIARDLIGRSVDHLPRHVSETVASIISFQKNRPQESVIDPTRSTLEVTSRIPTTQIATELPVTGNSSTNPNATTILTNARFHMTLRGNPAAHTFTVAVDRLSLDSLVNRSTMNGFNAGLGATDGHGDQTANIRDVHLADMEATFYQHHETDPTQGVTVRSIHGRASLGDLDLGDVGIRQGEDLSFSVVRTDSGDFAVHTNLPEVTIPRSILSAGGALLGGARVDTSGDTLALRNLNLDLTLTPHGSFTHSTLPFPTDFVRASFTASAETAINALMVQGQQRNDAGKATINNFQQTATFTGTIDRNNSTQPVQAELAINGTRLNVTAWGSHSEAPSRQNPSASQTVTSGTLRAPSNVEHAQVSFVGNPTAGTGTITADINGASLGSMTTPLLTSSLGRATALGNVSGIHAEARLLHGLPRLSNLSLSGWNLTANARTPLGRVNTHITSIAGVPIDLVDEGQGFYIGKIGSRSLDHTEIILPTGDRIRVTGEIQGQVPLVDVDYYNPTATTPYMRPLRANGSRAFHLNINGRISGTIGGRSIRLHGPISIVDNNGVLVVNGTQPPRLEANLPLIGQQTVTLRRTTMREDLRDKAHSINRGVRFEQYYDVTPGVDDNVNVQVSTTPTVNGHELGEVTASLPLRGVLSGHPTGDIHLSAAPTRVSLDNARQEITGFIEVGRLNFSNNLAPTVHRGSLHLPPTTLDVTRRLSAGTRLRVHGTAPEVDVDYSLDMRRGASNAALTVPNREHRLPLTANVDLIDNNGNVLAHGETNTTLLATFGTNAEMRRGQLSYSIRPEDGLNVVLNGPRDPQGTGTNQFANMTLGDLTSNENTPAAIRFLTNMNRVALHIPLTEFGGQLKYDLRNPSTPVHFTGTPPSIAHSQTPLIQIDRLVLPNIAVFNNVTVNASAATNGMNFVTTTGPDGRSQLEIARRPDGSLPPFQFNVRVSGVRARSAEEPRERPQDPLDLTLELVSQGQTVALGQGANQDEIVFRVLGAHSHLDSHGSIPMAPTSAEELPGAIDLNLNPQNNTPPLYLKINQRTHEITLSLGASQTSQAIIRPPNNFSEWSQWTPEQWSSYRSRLNAATPLFRIQQAAAAIPVVGERLVAGTGDAYYFSPGFERSWTPTIPTNPEEVRRVLDDDLAQVGAIFADLQNRLAQNAFRAYPNPPPLLRRPEDGETSYYSLAQRPEEGGTIFLLKYPTSNSTPVGGNQSPSAPEPNFDSDLLALYSAALGERSAQQIRGQIPVRDLGRLFLSALPQEAQRAMGSPTFESAFSGLVQSYYSLTPTYRGPNAITVSGNTLQAYSSALLQALADIRDHSTELLSGTMAGRQFMHSQYHVSQGGDEGLDFQNIKIINRSFDEVVQRFRSHMVAGHDSLDPWASHDDEGNTSLLGVPYHAPWTSHDFGPDVVMFRSQLQGDGALDAFTREYRFVRIGSQTLMIGRQHVNFRGADETAIFQSHLPQLQISPAAEGLNATLMDAFMGLAAPIGEPSLDPSRFVMNQFDILADRLAGGTGVGALTTPVSPEVTFQNVDFLSFHADQENPYLAITASDTISPDVIRRQLEGLPGDITTDKINGWIQAGRIPLRELYEATGINTRFRFDTFVGLTEEIFDNVSDHRLLNPAQYRQGAGSLSITERTLYAQPTSVYIIELRDLMTGFANNTVNLRVFRSRAYCPAEAGDMSQINDRLRNNTYARIPAVIGGTRIEAADLETIFGHPEYYAQLINGSGGFLNATVLDPSTLTEQERNRRNLDPHRIYITTGLNAGVADVFYTISIPKSGASHLRGGISIARFQGEAYLGDHAGERMLLNHGDFRIIPEGLGALPDNFDISRTGAINTSIPSETTGVPADAARAGMAKFLAAVGNAAAAFRAYYNRRRASEPNLTRDTAIVAFMSSYVADGTTVRGPLEFRTANPRFETDR